MRPTITIFCLACLSGCCVAHTASARDIVVYAQERQSDQQNRAVQNLLWYEGSESGYDYFKYVYGMAAERCFAVPTGNVAVPATFSRTSDASKWVQIASIGDFRFWTSDGP